MRTFVFISNIPDFLPQPIYKSDGKDGSSDVGTKKLLVNSKFDLRYERLRRLLVEHSSGVMLVMHLETKGYALALYASEGEALAACKADITPEQPGQTFSPLRLRILEKEKPRPPEPVYNPYLTVEGEAVRKADLADTRGLELVYRGRAVAKWCPRTLAGEDCYFGVSCLKLHKLSVQRTVRKRPRIDEEDAAANLSTEQQRTVRRLLASVVDARAVLSPPSLAMEGCLYVSVTQAEMEVICASPCDAAVDRGTTYQSVLQRVEAAMTTAAGGAPTDGFFFPRLSCPGGAPWDWAVESAEGRCALRRDCPLPANGAPTPLERDLYIQNLWYYMNERNRCRTASEVLQMLQGSRRVREALQRRQRESEAAAAAGTVDSLFLCLTPWLYLPTVGCEVTAFLERGGRRVRGVVQRYGQLRLMTSAALLATSTRDDEHDGPSSQERATAKEDADAQLSRYAVLGSGNDNFAEASLLAELRGFQRGIGAAVSHLAQHLQQHPESTGGDGAAWCVHLAVSLPHSPVSSSLSSPHVTVATTATAGASSPSTVAVATPLVVLLSCSDYHRALEECPLYSALAPSVSSSATAGTEESEEGGDALRAGKVEVTWNTQRHPYISLFSREVLEKLRVDATD